MSWVTPETMPVIGEWITRQFPEMTRDEIYIPHAAVAFTDDDGNIKGALGLRMLNRFDGSLSIYCEPSYFPNKAILRDLFHRTFNGLGLIRLTCSIARSNKRARRLVEALGFTLEGVKKRGYDGRQPACIYGMTADDCPWIEAQSNGLSRTA
jgi:hypothetical protein